MSEQSEFLTPEELQTVTGRKHASQQIAWLDQHGWIYERNAAQRPIVSRFYMRMRMSGINPTAEAAKPEAWSLDITRIS